MKVNDLRGKTEELSFDDLEVSKVYFSHKYQKYLMCVQNDWLVCLESGDFYDSADADGDVFTEVNAVLQIS